MTRSLCTGTHDLMAPKTNISRRSKSRASFLRFTEVKLENWRNFAKVGLTLQRRNFLVGPNAAGKSNFLDAFRFLGDIVSVGGGFEYAVGKREGVSEIRSLSARSNPNIAIEVAIGDDDSEPWRYRLVFGQDAQRRPQVKAETVSRGDRELLTRPGDDDQKDPERLRQTHLEQVTANLAFRPVADYFRSIRYYHIVPQLVRESDRWDSPDVDPYGGDFLERVMATSVKTRSARLRRIEKALVVAVPQLQDLEAVRDGRGVPHLRGRYRHWRPQGKWQTETQFSDGTLRLVGLLWSLLDGSGPLLLEEPELSLHPAVVRQLAQLITRMQTANPRQVLASTQSSDLLADPGIASDEIFLFTPSDTGTRVEAGVNIDKIGQLLDAGLSLPEVILPMTKPERAEELPLFAV